MALLILLAVMTAYPARAQTQTAPFPVDTSQFAKNASEVTNVSLDKTMLRFAAKFMSSDGEDQEARDIINHLQGIYVRDYEFKQSAAYSGAEVEALRRHFRGPEWNQIVSTRSKDEDNNTDIYVHTSNGQIDGMFIISAEPKELALVHIIGPIKPEDLGALSSRFGVPPVHDGKPKPKKVTPQ